MCLFFVVLFVIVLGVFLFFVMCLLWDLVGLEIWGLVVLFLVIVVVMVYVYKLEVLVWSVFIDREEYCYE